MNDDNAQSRRRFIVNGAFAAGSMAVGAYEPAAAQQLAPTPECGGEPTVRQTEGPFYKPRSPERSDLREAGVAGRTIALTGRVLSRACRPLAGVLVDLWHADAQGDYDNTGFRCRGHQFTDANGGYHFITIVPALYPGRTRHFHVKVRAPRQNLLTTQLYFPDEPQNRRDGLFRHELLMRLAKTGDEVAAQFDFVLDVR
jgi:protocatechuate 3,4-dioxygenase beta subunit